MAKKSSLTQNPGYDDAADILSVNGSIQNYFSNMVFNTDIDAHEIGKKSEETAKDMIRFIIERVLKWTPQEAYYHLTADVMKKFRIDEYARIMFSDINSVQENMRNNPKFILGIVYPKEIKNADSYRYDFLKTADARWAPGEISSFSLGKGADDWYDYFSEFLNTNYIFDSIERLYSIFANSADVIKKIKDAKLLPLLSTCNHPVELLDWYLVQTEYKKSKYPNFDTDLEQDAFCYYAAMIHSIRFSYSRHYKRYSDYVAQTELPAEPVMDSFSKYPQEKGTLTEIVMKKKEYDTMVRQLYEIAAIQKLDEFAGELIFPATDMFFTIDDWLAHDYEKYFLDMYIDVATLFTLRDANGEYIFSPITFTTKEEANEFNETREFLEKVIPEILTIK